jgi:Tir chaperone protein (CesT) family
MKNEEELAAKHEQNFARIIHELAQELAVDPEALLASRNLIVGDVDVGIVDYGAADYGYLTIFLDLGPIPAAREGAVNRRLLEQNLILPRTFGTFAVIPDNGHAALAYRFDIFDGTDGKAVANVIRDAVNQQMSLEKQQSDLPHTRLASAQHSRMVPTPAYSS